MLQVNLYGPHYSSYINSSYILIYTMKMCQAKHILY